MSNPIAAYTRWLHTRWPAGQVEKLPVVREDGSTNVPGIYVVGDLTGIPLLKFSADTGAKAVRTLAATERFRGLKDADALDLVIIGGGVSGFAAALEAQKFGLSFSLLEASEPFSTIVNFPKAKPIYTYPTEMEPAGEMRFTAEVKEPLIDELREQTLAKGIEPARARAEAVRKGRGGLLQVELAEGESLLAKTVIVAIGRSGNFRKLGVPGEELDKVFNRLHDPKEFAGQQVLVVGGGDSALEAAVALADADAIVTLSYRRAEFSRPKPDNVDAIERLQQAGKLQVKLPSQVVSITPDQVTLKTDSGEEKLPNEVVFSLIGREPPLDFFRRSGIRIAGEYNARFWVSIVAVLAAFTFIYLWKTYTWGPWKIQRIWDKLGESISTMAGDPSTLIGTINKSMVDPGFYYTLAYSVLIVVYGIRRIRRRRTPYVTVQTASLMGFQVLPLFLLPCIIFPWMGANGWFDQGVLKRFADSFMPNEGYWRAYGFILAWPLFVYNIFTGEPLMGWLVLGFIQTFVIIPLIVWRWGKGAYCGWICSCGAMAETLGDTHRHKMPHGPGWNRLNMVGQVILGFAFFMLGWRILGWVLPEQNVFARTFEPMLLHGTWKPVVDLMLAGILGFGLYFHFSGRVWCRFACPLAALMHIYARFSRFRILAEKKKCISCNVCTSVCHQGIDVMNFANKGLPMADPECVRCSACVQSCPTGVLSFGQIDRSSGKVLHKDALPASRVQMDEVKRT